MHPPLESRLLLILVGLKSLLFGAGCRRFDLRAVYFQFNEGLCDLPKLFGFFWGEGDFFLLGKKVGRDKALLA